MLRRAFNDLWRWWRGYSSRGGTWHYVGGALAVVCGAVGVAVTVGVQSPARTASAAHSSGFVDWNGYRAPTTTAPPTTVPQPAPVAPKPHVQAPRASRGSGPCDRPSNCPQLRQCEAGGNYGSNTGNGFYGAYQFDRGTARSNGLAWGSGSPAEQDAAADRLYAQRGSSPWPICGRFLH